MSKCGQRPREHRHKVTKNPPNPRNENANRSQPTRAKDGERNIQRDGDVTADPRGMAGGKGTSASAPAAGHGGSHLVGGGDEGVWV